MPSAPFRPCPGGCGTLVRTKGRCERCAKGAEQRRGSSNERGYTYRWHQRAQRFRRRYPFCGMRPDGQRPVMSRCFERGVATEAKQVDHVVPHRGDQTLFWDERGNWQSLCAECGARKSQAGL